MSNSYEAPELDKNGFTCPHCNAFAAMNWAQLSPYGNRLQSPFKIAICHRCQKPSAWHTREAVIRNDEIGEHTTIVGDMVYPDIQEAPLPNDDLPQDCINDYLEARSISNKSPRGAAALLRLCIQKLCVSLGGKGENINADISALVGKGLSIKVQQALDIVRVVGNNAVHPGEISVEDQAQTVTALFTLVNLIVDNQITEPKKVSELFETLPSGSKNAIERRDNKA